MIHKKLKHKKITNLHHRWNHCHEIHWFYLDLVLNHLWISPEFKEIGIQNFMYYEKMKINEQKKNENLKRKKE